MVRAIRIRLTGVLLLAAAGSICGWIPGASHASEKMRFQVMLDEKNIGYHSFDISDSDGVEVVSSRAELDIKILFIPAYSYVHENTEIWRNGCLHRIESKTDDNGEQFSVTGEKLDRVFVVNTRKDSRALEQDCVMTFAYWNRRFLSQPRLLNAQTGDYMPVSVEPLGSRTFDLAGEPVAEGYRVSSGDRELDISVWYSMDSGKWLALESRLSTGRLLRYLRVGPSGREYAGGHTRKVTAGSSLRRVSG